MSKKTLFPNWIKNLLILIALWDLSKGFGRPVEVFQNFIIVVCYPILLLLMIFLIKSARINLGRGDYFFNVSICIMLFFSFIFIVQYRNYVEYTGRLIGGHFSIETNYAKTEYDEYGKPFAPDLIVNKNSDTSLYYWAYALYISALSYFIVSTWYLSKRIKYLTDKIVKDENKS